MIPNIQLHTYNQADVVKKKKMIPSTLTCVKGTHAIHQVSCIVSPSGDVVDYYAKNLSWDVAKTLL